MAKYLCILHLWSGDVRLFDPIDSLGGHGPEHRLVSKALAVTLAPRSFENHKDVNLVHDSDKTIAVEPGLGSGVFPENHPIAR